MPRFSILYEELVFKLIEEVKKREYLFTNVDAAADRTNTDRLTILKGWVDVAEAVGKPEPLIRQKWKSLRDMFWKEVRRCGPPGSYTGRWRFYKHLTFIYKNHESLKPRKKHEDTDEDNESERGEPEYLDEEAETVTNFIKTEKSGEFETFYTEDPLKRPSEEEPSKKRRKHSEEGLKPKMEDFDVMFLTSLTPYFKQLEPLRKLVLRNKIQDMLLQELSSQMCANRRKS